MTNANGLPGGRTVHPVAVLVVVAGPDEHHVGDAVAVDIGTRDEFLGRGRRFGRDILDDEVEFAVVGDAELVAEVVDRDGFSADRQHLTVERDFGVEAGSVGGERVGAFNRGGGQRVLRRARDLGEPSDLSAVGREGGIEGNRAVDGDGNTERGLAEQGRVSGDRHGLGDGVGEGHRAAEDLDFAVFGDCRDGFVAGREGIGHVDGRTAFDRNDGASGLGRPSGVDVGDGRDDHRRRVGRDVQSQRAFIEGER